MTELDTTESAAATTSSDHEEHGPYHSDAQRHAAKLRMWLFLATIVLLFSGLFCAYGVFRANHPEVFHYGHQFLSVQWGLINTVILLFSSLAMTAAVTCAQRRQWRRVVLCLALTLACGMVFLGIRAIEYQQQFHDQPVRGGHFGPTAPPTLADAEPPTSATAPADPLADLPPELHRGYQLYTRSCLVCHGREGQGVSGLGLPLAGSDFLNERSDSELVAFIKKGRLPSDPDSQSGQFMPPRGGNPNLRDGDLAMIVQYLRSLEPPAEEERTFPTGPTLPRSVIAEAAQGPSGLRREVIENLTYHPTAFALQGVSQMSVNTPPDRARLFFGLYFLTTGLHTIHLAVGLGVIGYFMLRVIRRKQIRPSDHLPIEMTELYWHLAGLIWIFVFSFYYLIH